MEVPEECSICFALEEIKTHLERICQHINLTCSNKGRKKDFGLDLFYIQGTLNQVNSSIKYHRFYHANEEQEDLNAFNSVLDFGHNITPSAAPEPSNSAPAPKRFKRWKRKPNGNKG